MNTIVAAVTRKAGFPEIKTVTSLIAELEEKPVRVNASAGAPLIMTGGGSKAKLIFATLILLYVLAIYGFAPSEFTKILGYLTAAGASAFAPQLMQLAKELFPEKLFYIGDPDLARGFWTVIRLDFDTRDGRLIYSKDNPFRYYTPLSHDDTPGFMFDRLKNVPGNILYAVIDAHVYRDRYRLPFIRDGELYIPNKLDFAAITALLNKFRYRFNYNFVEERRYYEDKQDFVNNDARRVARGEPPLFGLFLNEGRENIPVCNVKADSSDVISLETIKEGDILINFYYGPAEYPRQYRLYNCDTHIGQTLLYKSYKEATEQFKKTFLGYPIDMGSRFLFKAHIVQAGGGRRRRRFRRTIRR